MRTQPRWTIPLLTILLALLAAPMSLAQDRPTSPPAAQDEPRDGRRLIGAFARLAETVEQLDLTDDQRRRVRIVFADLRETLADLRQAGGDPAAIRERVQQLQSDTRAKLGEILTPAQLDTLRDRMDAPPARPPMSETPPPAPPAVAPLPGEDRPRAPGRREAPPRNREPSTRPAAPPAGNDAPPMMGDAPPMMGDAPPMMGENPPMMGDAPRGASSATPAAPAPPAASATDLEYTPPTIKVGDPAPALDLQKTDGKPLKLETLRGRPVVLVFGSYSSPAFRSRVEIVEEMRKAYGNRIHIVYVYTREAHPMGVWDVERNRRDKISVSAHKHAGERMSMARQTETGLKLGGPVVVDDWENSVSRLFGGFPNGAAVLDRDGVVVALQRWCDPSGLASVVDEALKRPATRRP